MAFGALALPEDRPVWQVFDQLHCVGTTYIQCFHPRGSCVTDESQADIYVDFLNRRVTWMESSDQQRIVGRTFQRGVDAQSVVYLREPGVMLAFGGRAIDAEETDGDRDFPATLTRTDGYETFVHRLRCREAN